MVITLPKKKKKKKKNTLLSTLEHVPALQRV